MEAVYQSMGAQELYIPLGFNLNYIIFFRQDKKGACLTALLKGLPVMIHRKSSLKLTCFGVIIIPALYLLQRKYYKQKKVTQKAIQWSG